MNHYLRLIIILFLKIIINASEMNMIQICPKEIIHSIIDTSFQSTLYSENSLEQRLVETKALIINLQLTSKFFFENINNYIITIEQHAPNIINYLTKGKYHHFSYPKINSLKIAKTLHFKNYYDINTKIIHYIQSNQIFDILFNKLIMYQNAPQRPFFNTIATFNAIIEQKIENLCSKYNMLIDPKTSFLLCGKNVTIEQLLFYNNNQPSLYFIELIKNKKFIKQENNCISLKKRDYKKITKIKNTILKKHLTKNQILKRIFNNRKINSIAKKNYPNYNFKIHQILFRILIGITNDNYLEDELYRFTIPFIKKYYKRYCRINIPEKRTHIH